MKKSKLGLIVAVPVVALTAGACGATALHAKAAPAPAKHVASSSTPSSVPAPPTTPPTTAPSGPVQLAQGQPAAIAQNGSPAASVVVQSVTTSTTASSEYGDPPANGYFVVVTVAVSSSINGFDVNPVDFYDVDSNGTHYSMGDGNAFEALPPGTNELDLSTLNQGENATGQLAFDSATPHGEIVYAPNYDGAPLAEWSY